LWFASATRTLIYPPDSLPRDTVIWTFEAQETGVIYAATATDTAQLAMRVLPSNAPYLSCDKHSVGRGDSVSCRLSLPGGRAFIVDSTESLSSTFSPPIRRVGLTVAGGQAYPWSGPMVIPTRLKVYVSFDSAGTPLHREATDSVAVSPRTVGEFQMLPDPNPLYATISFPSGQAILDPPRNNTLGLTGYFHPTDTVSVLPFVIPVMTGPDSGLAYLNIEGLRTVESRTFIYPGLRGGDSTFTSVEGKAWYQRQNGFNGRCTQAQVDGLLPVVQRHEGITNDDSSHVGVANREYRKAALSKEVEAYVDVQVSFLIQRFVRRYNDFTEKKFYPAQKAFDRADYPRIDASLGCTLYNQ
jgi:hypothetical protein